MLVIAQHIAVPSNLHPQEVCNSSPYPFYLDKKEHQDWLERVNFIKSLAITKGDVHLHCFSRKWALAESWRRSG